MTRITARKGTRKKARRKAAAKRPKAARRTAAREGSFETELWMDQTLDLGGFQTALEGHFGLMDADIKLVIENADPDGHPGHRFLQVVTPLDRKDEVIPFFDQWAARHSADHEVSPRTTFPSAIAHN